MRPRVCQQAQNVEQEKTKAEAEKRKAQAAQITVDTMAKAAQALGRASGRIPAEVSLTK